MKISLRHWTFFIFLSILSFVIWFQFSYPQLAFINFSINRNEATQIAADYLVTLGEKPEVYQTATVFTFEKYANRYLQKNIGFISLLEFDKEYDFDMFFWIVRFFKEDEKEEYRVTVSSSTGQITSFSHSIESTAAREKVDKTTAQKRAEYFLQKRFQFNPDLYILKNDAETKHDNREDFSFAWQKKSVAIPWSEEKNAGTGKLLIGATVSGHEILSFYKNSFSVPEEFNRQLDKQKNIGRNLSLVVKAFYYALFISAIFFVITRRNHLAMHTSKKFYIGVMMISFLLSLFAELNEFEYTLFGYSTTTPFPSFIWRLCVNTIINTLFLTVAIMMPSLAGEALHYEVLKHKPAGSFLHHIRSTFFSRVVAEYIMLGYLVCIIMLGLQSFLIEIGQRYWGVWTERSWIDSLSTTYWPFIAAMTIGYKASFSEELMFRLFSISLGKKVFKNLGLAVFLSALLWGFAHSNYPVFPMWFRGVEVTCLGLFLSWVYLRYGLIVVITAHYLFDVFWYSAGYLLGTAKSFDFYSSLFIILLPFFFACIAFILNQKEQEAAMQWRLNKHQLFNLKVLKCFLKMHPEQFHNIPPEQLKQTIASHGWDIAVVEQAVDECH